MTPEEAIKTIELAKAELWNRRGEAKNECL